MNLEIKNLPIEVKKLLNIFGDDARLVGGCVRDLILEKEVNDFDFATRFLPQETIKILQKNEIKSLETGLKYGTVTAVVNGKNFEITTLREDENQRGRHCDVKFTDDYLGDASRRDFTINALYLDYNGEIYDYFDGISDLKKGRVKFIGNANKRIEEDFLRILRFFRFSMKYAKTIDQEGLSACILQKKNIKNLSRERIRGEFSKMFQAQDFKKLIEILKLMEREGILLEIFSMPPDIEALERLLKIDRISEFKLKIATIFLNNKSDIKQLLLEICATNKEKKFFNFLFETSDNLDIKELRRALTFYDKEFVMGLYLFYCAKRANFSKINFEYIDKFNLPKFPVSAQDLIAKGFLGKDINDNLVKLKNLWADSNFIADKEFLLKAL